MTEKTPEAARPRFAWFKDEVVVRFAHITAARAMRILVYAVAFFAVTSTIAVIYILHLVTKIDALASSNKKLIDTVQTTQKTGHASRLADQARTDTEIRSLACFLVVGIPDSASQGRAGQFRALYGCPAYTGPGQKPTPTPTKTIVLPGATTTETVTVPRPMPGPTVTKTRVRIVPAPKPTVCAGRVCITLPVK